ncbi:MAG: hypothetical protein HY360_01050 [Verrucomicrobia bacterium]|nr:hypothetical protein [Verrucomicrobiota bacterium]
MIHRLRKARSGLNLRHLDRDGSSHWERHFLSTDSNPDVRRNSGGRKWQGVRETGCCSVSAEGGDDPAVAE